MLICWCIGVVSAPGLSRTRSVQPVDALSVMTCATVQKGRKEEERRGPSGDGGEDGGGTCGEIETGFFISTEPPLPAGYQLFH